MNKIHHNECEARTNANQTFEKLIAVSMYVHTLLSLDSRFSIKIRTNTHKLAKIHGARSHICAADEELLLNSSGYHFATQTQSTGQPANSNTIWAQIERHQALASRRLDRQNSNLGDEYCLSTCCSLTPIELSFSASFHESISSSEIMLISK